MHIVDLKSHSRQQSRAFTLVEMLVVIAIMSVLMTAGAIGLGNMSGKGVTSGVAAAESLFDEARTIAISQRTHVRVLVANSLTHNPAENLRRLVVVSAEIDSATKLETAPQKWILASRGVLLPDQVFFSQDYSKKAQKTGMGSIEVDTLTTDKASYQGTYFYYEFSPEGICTTPGAGFVIGAGALNVKTPTEKPRVTAAGKRDFGGFVVWRNGRTSLFRSPTQIASSIQSINSGSPF